MRTKADLTGLLLAVFPGRRGRQVRCYNCGRGIARREPCYRVAKSQKAAALVVGFFCKECRVDAGPSLKKAGFFALAGNR